MNRAREKSLYFAGDLKKVVFIATEQNSFFTDWEKLLVATVFDKRRHIRNVGLRSVLKVRQTVPKFKGIRSFIISTLKCDAKNCIK